MQDYRGQCHCGKVRFEFKAEPIKSAMRCSCSICRRKGAYLSNFVIEKSDIRISSDDHTLADYQFGTEVARHYFCNTCGIFTHVETRLNPGCFRVNLGCIDGLEVFELPVELFDGDSI